MTKFSFKFKKPYFWSISPIFEAKKVLPKSWAAMPNFIRFLETCQNSEKSNSKKDGRQTDGRREGWTDLVDWHLKVKHIEYVCLTNNFCITVCMQNISSIYTLTQILGSHELNGHTHFQPSQPKVS